MAFMDKELEDQIEEVGNKLARPPSDMQQLLLLLDKTENLLSNVEQSPSVPMSAALQPAMKALIARDLLGHFDVDVKVAVASCLSEITRITAPDAPYDDDIMKEIFGLIVGAFKNLDEISSRSFPKRVLILKTVAKVRSCVLMLDLECDDLILEMFHHFLKTIRSTHSDNVFSSMETVLTLVIEESENISGRLLSCLLDHVKIDEKNIMPMAKKLAEKVLMNCALKLKPYLTELFKGIYAPVNDYSQIVAAICQGNLDTLMQNEMDASYETQGIVEQESGVVCSEKAVASGDKSSKLPMNNGTFQVGNEDSIASKLKTELSHHGSQLRDTNGASLADSDVLDSGAAAKPDGRSDISSRKGRGRGRKARIKLAVKDDLNGINDKKETAAISGRRKGCNKEADLSQAEGSSFKDVELVVCSKSEKNEHQSTSGLADGEASVLLHSPSEHDGTRSRRGRPPRSKLFDERNAVGKAAASGTSSTSGRSRLLASSQTTSGNLPLRESNSKESVLISDSKRKLLKSSARKSLFGSSEDSKTTPTSATSDSETKHQKHSGRNGSRRKVREMVLWRQKQSAVTKQQKGGAIHAEDKDKELKLKELVSSPKSTVEVSIKGQSHAEASNETKSRWKRARVTQEELVSSPKSTVEVSIKGQSHADASNETKSRWKRARVTQENFGTPKRRKGLNEALVGSKIKVWWPDDQRFYDGVVGSFDRSTKKHRILYNDGDVEVLHLKKEQWEFVDGESKIDGMQEKPIPHTDASEMRKRKANGTGDAASNKISLKSSPDSTRKRGNLLKQRGRPQGKMANDENQRSSKKARKSANRHPDKSHKDNNQLIETTNKLVDDIPKSVRRIKHGISKSSDKVDSDTLKRRGQAKDYSRSSRKLKKSDPKSGKKSGGSYNSGNMSAEGSPKTKSPDSRQKPGRRQREGFSWKAKGGITPRMSSNRNANGAPKNARSKVGEAKAGTIGKKRKRGRLSK